VPEDSSNGAIAAFAKAHGLAFSEHPQLPSDIDLLAQSDPKVGPGASGKLPGGIDGTISHYTYTTTDSDHHTHYHQYTVVLTLVPESMGFAPALGFSGAGSGVSASVGTRAGREVDLGEDEALDGARLQAYEGINEGWLHELISPSMVDWLARSPDDFGFQLSNGVLCAARNLHLTAAADLEALCNDASHVAGALRREAVEEVETGGASATAAKRPESAEDTMVANAMRKFGADSEVPDVGSAVRPFRRMILRNPGAWLFKLLTAALIVLVVNIPAAAIPILLAINGQILWLAVFEGALLLIVFFFVMRSHVRGGAEKYANEAFFRAYARDRKLTLEDPLHFSAVNAEAGLTFTPERVLAGELPGGASGSLALVGTGLKRADRIAIVAGPKGPVASLPLEVSPPGLSAEDLDGYAKRLAAKVAEERTAQGSR
jgi:hypothetical protein